METKQTETLEQFVARERIIARAVRVPVNPSIDDMGPDARHWVVTLETTGTPWR